MAKTKNDTGQPPPLTKTAFHILVVLFDGERHGYSILREISELADEKRLGPTTLYRSIRTLLEAGLIEESAERPVPELDDDRRRYYRITDLGTRAARAEADRLARLLKVAERKRLLSGRPSRVVVGGRK